MLSADHLKTICTFLRNKLRQAGAGGDGTEPDRHAHALAVSYQFKKIPAPLEQVPLEWNKAENLPMAPNSDQSQIDDFSILLLLNDKSSVMFPLEGWAYRNFSFVQKHALPIESRRIEGPKGSSEPRRHFDEETRGDRLHPNDFDSLIPSFLKGEMVLTETRLRQHFRISEAGAKATALEIFLQWAAILPLMGAESPAYSAHLRLGKELHRNLRLTAASVDLKVPQLAFRKQLERDTCEDPEEIAIEKVRQREGRGGNRFFRAGGRGRGLWIPRGQETSNTGGNQKPRTCRFCGEQHVGSWASHNCQQLPKNKENGKK